MPWILELGVPQIVDITRARVKHFLSYVSVSPFLETFYNYDKKKRICHVRVLPAYKTLISTYNKERRNLF